MLPVCAYTRTIITLHIFISWGAHFQVLIRISDLTIIKGEAKTSQIAEAMEWARTNRESLALKWAELNERG